MSRRTRRSSPRRSYRFSQGVQPIPRSCEPVLDRQFALRALFGATPWPRHARSRRLPPSPPCRPDTCEAMQSNCVAPTRSLGSDRPNACIHLVLGNIDTDDNQFVLCHHPLPSLPGTGSKPLQLFGLRKTPELSLALLTGSVAFG